MNDLYIKPKWGEKPKLNCGNCKHLWQAFDRDGNGPESTCILNQSEFKDPFFGVGNGCEKWEPSKDMIAVPETQAQ